MVNELTTVNSTELTRFLMDPPGETCGSSPRPLSYVLVNRLFALDSVGTNISTTVRVTGRLPNASGTTT